MAGLWLAGLALSGVVFLAACQGSDRVADLRLASPAGSTDWSAFFPQSFKHDRSNYVSLQTGLAYHLEQFSQTANSAQQHAPVIAFDGVNYLLVWQDDRNPFWNAEIYGTRVNAAGQILDSVGIEISQHGANQTQPAVVFDGTNYVVVWRDDRADTEGDIYGTRVSPAGQVLDATGVAVATASGSQTAPAIASMGGSTAFVVWSDARDPAAAQIFGTRIDAALQPLDSAGVAVFPGASAQVTPTVATNGSEYLVFWASENSAQLLGRRVDVLGTAIQGTDIVVDSGLGLKQHPALSFGGGEYVLAWQDSQNGGADIFGLRFDASGTALDSSAIGIAVQADADAAAPRVASGATGHAIVWQDKRNEQTGVYGRALTAGIVGSETTYQAGDECGAAFPSIAAGAAGFGIGWMGPNCDGDIMTQLLDVGATSVSTPVIASMSAAMENDPALAFGATNYLAVWHSHRGTGRSNIRARAVLPHGAPVGSSSDALTTDGSATVHYFQAVVASAKGEFLVVWTRREGANTSLHGARLADDGTVLETGLSFGEGQLNSSPALAANGDEYLLVYERASATANDVYSQRITSTGAVLGPPSKVEGSVDDGWEPAVVSNGTGFLIAWATYAASGPGITAVSVAADLSSNYSAAWPVGPAANVSDYRVRPQLAYGANTYLVLWTAPDAQLKTLRLDPVNGAGPNAPELVHQGDHHSDARSVTFDGSAFVIAWEQANGSGQPDYDVVGRRQRIDGTWIDTASVTLNTSTDSEMPSALASDGAGSTMLVLSRFVRGPAEKYLRIHGQTVNWSPLGVACALGDECSSGYCVDGVCCNRPCGDGRYDCQACSILAGATVDGTCETFAAGTACRLAAGACDGADTCDGLNVDCPADEFLPDGTACGEFDLCSVDKVCTQGVCEGTPLACAPAPECYSAGPCNPSTGVCSYQQEANGAACDGGFCANGICAALPGDGGVDAATEFADGGANDAALQSDHAQVDAADQGVSDSPNEKTGDGGPGPGGCECAMTPRESASSFLFWAFAALFFFRRRIH